MPTRLTHRWWWTALVAALVLLSGSAAWATTDWDVYTYYYGATPSQLDWNSGVNDVWDSGARLLVSNNPYLFTSAMNNNTGYGVLWHDVKIDGTQGATQALQDHRIYLWHRSAYTASVGGVSQGRLLAITVQNCTDPEGEPNEKCSLKLRYTYKKVVADTSSDDADCRLMGKTLGVAMLLGPDQGSEGMDAWTPSDPVYGAVDQIDPGETWTIWYGSMDTYVHIGGVFDLEVYRLAGGGTGALNYKIRVVTTKQNEDPAGVLYRGEPVDADADDDHIYARGSWPHCQVNLSNSEDYFTGGRKFLRLASAGEANEMSLFSAEASDGSGEATADDNDRLMGVVEHAGLWGRFPGGGAHTMYAYVLADLDAAYPYDPLYNGYGDSIIYCGAANDLGVPDIVADQEHELYDDVTDFVAAAQTGGSSPYSCNTELFMVHSPTAALPVDVLLAWTYTVWQE